MQQLSSQDKKNYVGCPGVHPLETFYGLFLIIREYIGYILAMLKNHVNWDLTELKIKAQQRKWWIYLV